jgi:hypothetical protein
MKDGHRAPRPLEGSVWAGRLAMLFVFVALAVLAVVPALLQRRLAPLREQAEAADEARTLVTRVQFALAAQTSALRDALLTPGSAHPRLYAQAAELERSAYPALDSLTAHLSDSARVTLLRLRGLSDAWHASVDEDAVLRRGAAGGTALLSRGRPLYEQALLQARTLDAAVAQAAAGGAPTSDARSSAKTCWRRPCPWPRCLPRRCWGGSGTACACWRTRRRRGRMRRSAPWRRHGAWRSLVSD